MNDEYFETITSGSDLLFLLLKAKPQDLKKKKKINLKKNFFFFFFFLEKFATCKNKNREWYAKYGRRGWQDPGNAINNFTLRYNNALRDATEVKVSDTKPDVYYVK